MSFLDGVISVEPKSVEGVESKGPNVNPDSPHVRPMPAIADITYMQCSLLDNGERKSKTGRKSTGQRFKMTTEIWTCPVEEINKHGGYQFKRNIELREAMPFLSLLQDQLKRNVISDDDRDTLMEMIEAHLDSGDLGQYMYGQVHQNSNGRHYVKGQYVVVRKAPTDKPGEFELIATYYVDGKAIRVDGFNSRHASGNYKLTAYKDQCGYQVLRRNKS